MLPDKLQVAFSKAVRVIVKLAEIDREDKDLGFYMDKILKSYGIKRWLR
jgi:hypothetical protein